MFVKMIFDAQFCGMIERVVEMAEDSTDSDIRRKFEAIFHTPFNQDCRYYRLSDGEGM